MLVVFVIVGERNNETIEQAARVSTQETQKGKKVYRTFKATTTTRK
jgi:hypothetical protein